MRRRATTGVDGTRGVGFVFFLEVAPVSEGDSFTRPRAAVHSPRWILTAALKSATGSGGCGCGHPRLRAEYVATGFPAASRFKTAPSPGASDVRIFPFSRLGAPMAV